mmetsp:Transcript_16983/g.46569  ORF Transcript_16983/g.46569 Transcript_16983/m.46569 type:complete len:98 (-) Transcript_16983:387-680(-)
MVFESRQATIAPVENLWLVPTCRSPNFLHLCEHIETPFDGLGYLRSPFSVCRDFHSPSWSRMAHKLAAHRCALMNDTFIAILSVAKITFRTGLGPSC